MLDKALVKAINQQIYRKFPEISGKTPRIQIRKAEQSKENGKLTFLLTYQGQVQISADRTMDRSVRVVVDEDGRILKVTTSR